MQTFIAGYCEISLIKSASERRNHFEPETDGYYNRKANTSSANTIGNDTGRTGWEIECYPAGAIELGRDVNEPDLNTLKKFVFFLSPHGRFCEGGNKKMETCEKKRNDNLISMIWQLDFFYGVGYFLALVFSLLAVL